MKRFWKWTLVFVVLMGGLSYYGYKKVFNYASDKMVDEITQQVLTKEETTKLLKDPQVQELMKQQAKDGAGLQTAIPPPPATGTSNQVHTTNSNKEAGSPNSSSNSTPSSETGKSVATQSQPLAFHSRTEAMQFLLSKFSISEIKDFIAMGSRGVTPQEKAQIKSKVMERLTPEEYQALKVFGLMELQKQK